LKLRTICQPSFTNYHLKLEFLLILALELFALERSHNLVSDYQLRSYAVELEMLSQCAMFVLLSTGGVGVCNAIRLASNLTQITQVRNSWNKPTATIAACWSDFTIITNRNNP
jgi:hypothetical protein